MSERNATQQGRTIKLMVTEEGSPPVVQLKPGMKFEVISVTLVDSSLSTLQEPQLMAARLCGGSGTCLAVVEEVIESPT